MEPDIFQKIDNFIFRDLHPRIRIGTASDRYSGWIGQIYTPGKYEIVKRSRKVGNRSFTEEILSIESVPEYFQHFEVLEIDFTFYKPLLNKNLQPTSNYKILQGYNKYLKDGDGLFLKVPQVIFAQKLWQAGRFIENSSYLNVEMFINQFYDPANAILGDHLKGFIFEQEYQRKADRISPKQFVEDLEGFVDSLPRDDRYHFEIRTDYYHTHQYFELIQKHGLGHILSHWTWLPPLRKQFIRANKTFYNKGKECVIRLLTPLRVNYQDSYVRTFPFDNIIQGMMNPEMISDAVEIVEKGKKEGFTMNLIVNNRTGGNAPLIARELAGRLIST